MNYNDMSQGNDIFPWQLATPYDSRGKVHGMDEVFLRTGRKVGILIPEF